MESEAERVQQRYKAMSSLLTEKEKDVITRFYGIEPNVRHTLAEIASIYKVTRERIRQIKTVALSKINIIK